MHHSRRKILVTSSLKPSNVFVQLKHQPSLTVWKTLVTTTQHLLVWQWVSPISQLSITNKKLSMLLTTVLKKLTRPSVVVWWQMMTVMLLLQQHGVKRKKHLKNVWLKHKILRTQSLWWWTQEPVVTSLTSLNLPVCVVWWPLLTDVSWNCLSFQTSVKVWAFWKCSSLLTVRVKVWPIRPLRQPTQVTLLVVWLTLPKMLSSVKTTVEQTVVFSSVRLLMVKKWRKHLKNVFKDVTLRNQLRILQQVK